MHCSDQDLLQWLDGECDGAAAAAVDVHLRSCWSCRARKDELENAICTVARQVLSDRGYPGARIDEARRRFATRAAAARPESAPRPPRLDWKFSVVGTALAAAALVAAVWLRIPSKETLPDAMAALRRTQQYELSSGTAMTGPYIAELQIQRIDARGTVRPRQVRIAVDSRTGRRLVGRNRADTTIGATVGDWWQVAADAEQQDLEAQLAGWIRSHSWEPVLLSKNFSLFVERTGATLTVRKAAETVYNLTAERDLSDGRWQVSMEVTLPDYRPVSLAVYNDRTGGWRIRPLSIRRLSEEETRRTFVPAVPPIIEESHRAVAPPERGFPAAALLEAVRLLHSTGACTRDQVEIETADAPVKLSIVAADATRKRELLDALSAVQDLAVSIRSPEDAPADGTLPVILHHERGAAPARGIAAEARLSEVLGTTDQRALIAWADRTVRLSELAVSHATALNRLADAFDERALQRLNGFQRELLASIVLDHARALELHLQTLRSQVEQFTDRRVQAIAPTGPDEGWRSHLRQWTVAVRRLHADVYALFTVGGSPKPDLDLAVSMAEANRGAGEALVELRSSEARAGSFPKP